MFSLMLCVFYSKPFSSFLRLDVESLLPIITAAAASWAALGRMILPDIFRGDADCCWWQYISLEVAAQKQRKINNWEMKLNVDGREIMDRWGFRPCPHMWAIFPHREISICRFFLLRHVGWMAFKPTTLKLWVELSTNYASIVAFNHIPRYASPTCLSMH